MDSRKPRNQPCVACSGDTTIALERCQESCCFILCVWNTAAKGYNLSHRQLPWLAVSNLQWQLPAMLSHSQTAFAFGRPRCSRQMAHQNCSLPYPAKLCEHYALQLLFFLSILRGRIWDDTVIVYALVILLSFDQVFGGIFGILYVFAASIA